MDAASITTRPNSILVFPKYIYHQHVTYQIVIYGSYIRYNHAKMPTHKEKKDENGKKEYVGVCQIKCCRVEIAHAAHSKNSITKLYSQTLDKKTRYTKWYNYFQAILNIYNDTNVKT